MITIIAVIWIAGATVSYGLSLGYFQRNWPELAKQDRQADIIVSVCCSLLAGPFLIFLILYRSLGRTGFMWWPK